MKNTEFIKKVALVVVAFIALSFGLQLIGGLLGGLVSLFFRFGIPLLLAYYLVTWLTKRSNNKRNYYR